MSDIPAPATSSNASLRFAPRPGRAAVAFSLTAVAGSIGFWGILNDVFDGDSSRTDRFLLERAHLLAVSPDGAWLTPAARALSLFGNWQVLIPAGLLLLYGAWRHRLAWRIPIFYLVACFGAGSLILLVKHLVNRPRPELFPALDKAPFASFPSGHALYALVAYGFLSYLVVRSLRFGRVGKVVLPLLAALLTVLVGASRVYLGAHYPTDVAAGWLLGLPWLSALIAGEHRYRAKQSSGSRDN